MAEILTLAPPQRNMKGLAIKVDDVLDMAKEADLSEVLVIGRDKAGEVYIKGAKLGIYQQSRRDIRDLCTEVLDRLMIARMAEETA